VALYRMEEWLEHYDVEVLLGEGVRPASFNDTRLAACLDHLFDTGSDVVISRVAARYVHSEYAPRCYSVHGDTTTLALQGAYDVIPDEGAVLPTFGYSKDKRPDLKQVMFGLTLHGETCMPLSAAVLDGNTSEQAANRLSIDQLASLLRPDDEVTLVADCKLVDPVTLGRVLDEQFDFISLMPDSYALRQTLITSALANQAPMPELAREPGRTKKDPPHIYKGRSYSTTFPIKDPHTPGKDGLHPRKMRALVVSSPQLRAKFDASLERTVQREVESFQRALRKANEEPFRCEPDALTAISTMLPPLGLHKATVVVERHEKKLPRAKRGRPKKGEDAPVEVSYGLTVQEMVTDEAAIDAAREAASHFVLLTSHLDEQAWPDARVLSEYRKQHRIEGIRGFRWFKSEARVCPLFLKTPRRINALCTVFVLALMVHNSLQHGDPSVEVGGREALSG
jgi:transposase